MSHMVNPHDALLSYQTALKQRRISPSGCAVHREMTVMMDDANGESRLTYALAGPGNVVKAIAIYISAGFHEGVPCFQLGYAVDESFRKQGIATEVVKKSLDEMRTGFKSHMPRFYVEAVVGKSNEASNRLASKLLSSTPKDGIDEVSGESAFQYFLLVE